MPSNHGYDDERKWAGEWPLVPSAANFGWSSKSLDERSSVHGGSIMNHHTPTPSTPIHTGGTAMNAQAALKPVELGRDNLYEIERIARAMDHVITCYRAVPAFPENKETRDHYWSTYQGLCAEMLGALHG